ncbi:MAG: transporter permease [Devosia sp.]|nr:transporter permease [Devosia sp.]
MSVGTAIRLLALIVLVVFLLRPELFSGAFALFTKNGQPAIYSQGSLLDITLNHLAIVLGATMAATVVAAGLAILVTRPFGAEFLPLCRSVANLGQTFPPVAVLALAVPALNSFGTAPTLLALFLYGLLPIFENTLTGLSNLPAAVTDAANGMGMTGWQRLVQIELPLALPVILAGVRLSTVIALSTATIGSTVAARTLGEVIIAGLLSGNTAFVLQGGLVVAVLAVLIHDGLAAIERVLLVRTGQLRR